MELSDTVEFMISKDWKERLKAEYWQTRIRAEGLSEFLSSKEYIEQSDTDETGLLLLATQLDIMNSYLTVLYSRIVSLDLKQYVFDTSDISRWEVIK